MTAAKTVCLDASTALAFVFPNDPLHAKVKAAMIAFAAGSVTFHVPAMFVYECDSVIRLQVSKKAITPAQAQLMRAAVYALPLVIEYDANDRDRAYAIATEYDQPRAYDAAYAAHAEARGLELVTIDEPFFEAVNGSKKPKSAEVLTFVKLLK